MKDEAEDFSEKESLRLINEMIGKAKKSYVTKGVASIVWGSLIIICSLVTAFEIKYRADIGFDIWLILIVALILQIYFGIKEKSARQFTAHEEAAVKYVWLSFSAAIFILSFYNAKFRSHEAAPLFMMLYGMPTFITGGIAKFRPMIIGGVLCWLFSAAAMFTPEYFDMLFMAGSGLFAWLIPGIILWNRFQKSSGKNV